ncbi:hypothetical protein FRB95_010641 [Tulasnella sp. JGI-2019a]|nr:hypothetical protein FRB95_010641 [Tulasnella sp. JGI-2019a]
MAAPTQVLPPWLSASTSWITTGGAPTPTTYVVPLPETYYGPSIPLNSAWVYGGSTSPPPGATSTGTASTTASAVTIASLTIVSTISGAPSISSTTGIAASSAASASATLSASGTAAPITAAPSSTSSLGMTITASSSSSSNAATSTLSSLSSSSASTSVPISSSSTSTTTSATPNPTGVLQKNISNNGLSRGAIIAIATVISLFGFLLLLYCVFLFLRRRRRRRRDGTSRNGGRSLQGDTSVLPPGPDERGSLLAGRQNGGESPAEPEMLDISGTPIAHSFISARRRREAEGKGYHAVNTGSVSGPIEQIFAADSPGSHSGHGSDETRQTSSSHAMFGQGSSSYHGFPPSPTSPMLEHESEEAELVTAQRATRSPLARLARFSWFARNRNTLGTSMVASAGTDEEHVVAGRVEPRGDGRRHSASALPLQQAAGVPIVATRAFRSAADITSPPASPPPTSYLNRPPAELGGVSQRQSVITTQSGTVYHTAHSRPISSYDPQQFGIRDSLDTDTGPVPTSADFPSVPAGEVPWPRFGRTDPSPETNGEISGSGSSDPLDAPAPEPAGNIAGAGTAGPSGVAKGWASGSTGKQQPAPDIGLSLDDTPPPASGSWMQNPSQDTPRTARSGSNRMTLGPASFVDTPQVVSQQEVASLHGDTHSHYGDAPSLSASNRQPRSSTDSERNREGTDTITNAPSTMTPFSTASQAHRGRMPSLSAIGGRSSAHMAHTIGSHQSGTDEGTGSGSAGGTSSGVLGGSETTRITSEYGELASTRPDVESPRRAPPPGFRLPEVAETFEGSSSGYHPIATPPPSTPTVPKPEPLSPRPVEPKKSWWKY